MKKTLTLMALALTLAAPALAQTAAPSMPAGEMKMPAKMPDTMMKAAPTFAYSTESGMNMMMNKSGAVEITAAPGEKLISRKVGGTSATLIYSGKNSALIFGFYDKAIKAEGWKTTAMDGRAMTGDTMKPADTMAKPADTMTGAMMGGTHSATFAMGGHSIDLKVSESGGRVTVSFRSQ